MKENEDEEGRFAPTFQLEKAHFPWKPVCEIFEDNVLTKYIFMYYLQGY